MRYFLLAGLVCLSGCTMPQWWPEALGGPAPRDKIFEGPLRTPVVRHPELLGLPPLQSVGRNGLRASIAPSSGIFDFVVDFAPRPLNCYLIVSGDFEEAARTREICRFVEVRYTMAGGPGQTRAVRRYQFVMPLQDYALAIEEFNRLAEGWRGSSAGWLDGTTIGIEQFHDGSLRSMISNSPPVRTPNDPAATISLQLHRLLLAYAPAGTVPLSGDFAVADAGDAGCERSGLNVPDPDGFGVGDDACARALAAHPPLAR